MLRMDKIDTDCTQAQNISLVRQKNTKEIIINHNRLRITTKSYFFKIEKHKNSIEPRRTRWLKMEKMPEVGLLRQTSSVGHRGHDVSKANLVPFNLAIHVFWESVLFSLLYFSSPVLQPLFQTAHITFQALSQR